MSLSIYSFHPYSFISLSLSLSLSLLKKFRSLAPLILVSTEVTYQRERREREEREKREEKRRERERTVCVFSGDAALLMAVLRLWRAPYVGGGARTFRQISG